MQVEWDGYDVEPPAVDAIVMQTRSTKLLQEAIQDNPSYEKLVKMGISHEQAKMKADSLREDQGSRETGQEAHREVEQGLG